MDNMGRSTLRLRSCHVSPHVIDVCYRRLCGSPIVCARSSASSAAVVQRSSAASLGVGGRRKESGLALLLSSSNICGPPGAMLQVSGGARLTCARQRLCQQIQRQANSAHVINQAINPINLLYAFYFEARFPLSEASYSIWIKGKII